MAGNDDSGDLASLLKPFHERAQLAEERLEKLEAALEEKRGSARAVDSGLLDSLLELRAKLETSRAEQLAERKKAAQDSKAAALEREKLQYQILHLKRSLEQADKRLEAAGIK